MVVTRIRHISDFTPSHAGLSVSSTTYLTGEHSITRTSDLYGVGLEKVTGFISDRFADASHGDSRIR
jgi:hypothetical protein